MTVPSDMPRISVREFIFPSLSGEDDEATPRLFGWHITTKFEIDLSNSTLVWFAGLLDSAGNRVTSEVLKPTMMIMRITTISQFL